MIEISRVVIGICPWLSSASTYMDTAEWDRQYFAAFAALAHINRCDTPDTRWLLPHWTGRLETIARALGHFAQITGAPMTAAILGIGDVPHDVGVVSHMTRTASFGLVDGSGRAPNAAGWKRVLETSASSWSRRPARSRHRRNLPLPDCRADHWSLTRERVKGRRRIAGDATRARYLLRVLPAPSVSQGRCSRAVSFKGSVPRAE